MSKVKQAELKKGSGAFVYVGGAIDTEFIPGKQATDDYGNKIFNKKTRKPVWEKEPKLLKKEVETFKLRGYEFPKGEHVVVGDAAIALKLRALECFEELEAVEVVEEGGEVPKKRRSKKSEAEVAS